MNGILPLWKPKGMTSHDCVMKCRKYFQTRKVGHTGTLDPEVEGVLPICIGKATKIVPFLTDTRKTYTAKLKLGYATETEDAHGKVISSAEVKDFPSDKKLEAILNRFTGEISQVPPMYSAVKVNGRKLYEYARANEEVERPKRKVTIFRIERLESHPETDEYTLKIVCSKGTYIRTLCVDIGNALGFPAHMSELVRNETGAFNESNSVTFDKIEEAVQNDRREELLYPILEGLSHLDRIEVDEVTKGKVLNGQKLSELTAEPVNDPFVVTCAGQLLAVYMAHPEHAGLYKPVRVFAEEI